MQVEIEKILRDLSLLSSSVELEKLPGDASNRSYSRVVSKSENKSWMLMHMNAPEAFKSEEASSEGQRAESSEMDFVAIAKDWREQSIRVPQIFYVDPQNRFVILEDFGDELLYDRREKPDRLTHYKSAIESLVRIQSLQPILRIRSRGFSRDLLNWELEHFVEYAVEKRGLKMDLVAWRSFFSSLLDRLESLDLVVCHRDFHSKNIILSPPDHKIGVIDFQDALMGPATYDLASLLRDSYVDLTPDEEGQLLDFYASKSSFQISKSDFVLTSLQRNLKAVGRFFYISMVKKKDTHLPFVKPSLVKICRSLESLDQSERADELQRVFEKDLA